MKDLKIAVIGAGSTYNPELIDGFIKRKDELPLESIYLMDIDSHRLEIVGRFAQRMLEAAELKCRVVLTGDLRTAVEGADFIITQIRVGKLDARIKDEKLPLKYDLIGQETTGIGGFMKAMRTIPVMVDIAHCISKYCPDAWLINFTNPSGLITEMLLNYTDVKAIGLCNLPINTKKWIVEKVLQGSSDVIIDYVGLNHLNWVTGIYNGGKNILEDLLSGKGDYLNPKDIPDTGMDIGLLKCIQGFPCGYLSYYYYRDRQLTHLKTEVKSRGEVCKEIEEELLQLYQNSELNRKPEILDRRGGAMYSEAAVSLISAIYNDKNEVHVVNTKNRGTLDFMDYDDVVEISCNVNRNGATPIPLKGVANDHIKGMMRMVKNYERHAARAGIDGSYEEAFKALLIHPLAGDYEKTKGALDELLEAHREFLPQFFKQ